MLIKNKSESFIILNFLKFYLTNGNKQISENVIRSGGIIKNPEINN